MIIIDENDKTWLREPKNQLLLRLAVAYNEARGGGKRSTFDEHKFEEHEWENLISLRDSLLNRTYRPSRGTAHIIHNPVIREIFAAPFRDRVIHHLIYNYTYDFWDRRFISDSYSCRENRGTNYGINRLAHHINSVSNCGKNNATVFKFDLQSYFMSLNRKTLFECVLWGLNEQFKHNKNWEYELLIFCWKQIIFDDPCEGVNRKGKLDDWDDLPKHKSLFNQNPGFGIVIGNLTSQLISNIVLDRLDRFIKYDLGYKHYGRYVDDFYFIVSDAELEKAKKDVKIIEQFIKNLGLILHPKKRLIQPVKNGVPFLGAVVYPNRIVPGKRVVKNFRRAVYEVATGQRDPESIQSYLGLLGNFKSEKMITRVFRSVGWDYKP